MSADLASTVAAFRNRSRTRLVLLTEELATAGAGGGALLRKADLLTDTLDVLAAPFVALPEARLRLLLQRVDELCRLWELALVPDPDDPLPLPAPDPLPAPIYTGGPIAPVFPVGAAGQVWTSQGGTNAHWEDPSASFFLSGITEFRDRFGPSFSGTLKDFARTLLVRYQVPAYTAFALDGQGSRTVEVGTAFPAVSRTFTWSTSNGANVVPGTTTLRDLTGAVVLLGAGANDGSENLTPAAFTAVAGESRHYRISATDTQGGVLVADLVIAGALRLYFGPATAIPATRTQALALGGTALTSDGNTFTLHTGTVRTVFVLLVPPGKTLAQVNDPDHLNADLTSAYVLQSTISLSDAAGVLVAGYKPYRLTITAPYDADTRHVFTLA